jgi:hypothetical protein
LPVRVPEQHIIPLRDLAELEEEKYERIKAALKGWEPSLQIEGLISSLSEDTDSSETDTANFLSILVNIYSLQHVHGWSMDDVFQGILGQIQEVPGREAPLTEEQVEKFRAFLEEVSGLDETFGVMAKGLGLVEEDERNLADARVISDLRPIFRPDSETDIIASAIKHNLRISYRHRTESQVEDFFVSLDEEDLRNLKDEIERALAKAETIREGGVQDAPILTGGDNE